MGSLSPNSSLIKNSSNDFSHVRMSSPNKEEANVPEFNPPLEIIVQNKVVLSVLYVPIVTSVPLVKSVPSAQNVPLITSVPSAQNVKPKIRTYADVVSSRVNQNDLSNRYNTKTGNNNGISSKYLANFNIFLKRKNDLEVEVNNLLLSAKNDQIQPSTLKLKGNDLKSKLTSLKIEKWIEDDRMGYFDPIDLCNWEDKIGRDIASVLYKTEELINLRKGLAQSGIKKGILPAFPVLC